MARGRDVVPVQDLTSDIGQSGKQPSIETLRETPQAEALYWFGALPARGKRKVTIPEKASDVSLDDASTLFNGMGELTAFQMWFPRTWVTNSSVKFPSRWMGECPWYQNIGARGIEFVAFSQQVMSDPTNEAETIAVSWPGSVAKFTDEQIEAILKSVRNHAYRPFSNKSGAEVIDYTFGHLDGCEGGLKCTCREIEMKMSDAARQGGDYKSFVPARRIKQRGDVPMADFVYLRRLEADIATSPSEYPSLVPGFEGFLKNPPPALSKSVEEAKAAVA